MAEALERVEAGRPPALARHQPVGRRQRICRRPDEHRRLTDAARAIVERRSPRCPRPIPTATARRDPGEQQQPSLLDLLRRPPQVRPAQLDDNMSSPATARPGPSRLARHRRGTTELARSGRRGRTAWTALASAILADVDSAAGRKLSGDYARFIVTAPGGRRRSPAASSRPGSTGGRRSSLFGSGAELRRHGDQAGWSPRLAAPLLAGCGGSGGGGRRSGARRRRAPALAARRARYCELGGSPARCCRRPGGARDDHRYADLDCASCSTVHRAVLPHVIARRPLGRGELDFARSRRGRARRRSPAAYRTSQRQGGTSSSSPTGATTPARRRPARARSASTWALARRPGPTGVDAADPRGVERCPGRPLPRLPGLPGAPPRQLRALHRADRPALGGRVRDRDREGAAQPGLSGRTA